MTASSYSREVSATYGAAGTRSMTMNRVQGRGALARWRWLVPIFSTVVLYAAAYFTCWAGFGIKIVESRVPYDLGLNLALAFLVFSVSRRVWPFLLLQFLYFAVLYVASALKIA